MNHIDQVRQLATERIAPFNQFSWQLPCIRWIGDPHKRLIAGPLYNVIVRAPAKDTKVPAAFASPWVSFMLMVSSLHIMRNLTSKGTKRTNRGVGGGVHEFVSSPEYHS